MATSIPVEQKNVLLKEQETADYIHVPRAVFLAFQQFLLGNKPSGSITVHFKDGGICGVEALTKQTYK